MGDSERSTAALISLILRLSASSLLLANAIGKFIGGAPALVSYFQHVFQNSWLPGIAVTAMAYVTPYVEIVLTGWLVVGVGLRAAWTCAAVYMLVLAFGMTIAQQYDTAAHNYVYVAICCAGMYFSSADRWHIGGQKPRVP